MRPLTGVLTRGSTLRVALHSSFGGKEEAMTTEENKAVLRRVHEAINSGDLDAYAQLLAPDAVDHGLPPGFPAGPEGGRTLLTMIRGAFPDFQFTTDDLIAEGDKVVARLTCTGTHQGDFMGLPATGKQVSWGVI